MGGADGAASDRRFMELALRLGRRGSGRVWPAPAVGCVLVRDGRVVGRGWTAPGGRPHAERMALVAAGAAARGATAYVTLEPCAHAGRGPACAEALISAQVGRVVAAMRDPDPRTDGRGLSRLAAAGIPVEAGLCEAEARAEHAGFLMRIAAGRPRLSLKLATSVDGRIATASGESRWITGPGARRLVHMHRARHDAVLVGGGTARADDPMLTVRGLGQRRGARAQPVRVVAARRLDLPEGGRLAASAADVPLWLLHGPDAPAPRIAAWQARGARCLPVAAGSGGDLDPQAMLRALGAAGLTSVLCEGGGSLAAALLSAGLVDELLAMIAGLALGAEGRPGLGALDVSALAAAPRFALVEARALDGDALTRWRPKADEHAGG